MAVQWTVFWHRVITSLGFSPYNLVSAERMLRGVKREEKRVPRVSSAHELYINIHNQFLVRLALALATKLYTLIEFCKLSLIYYQHYLYLGRPLYYGLTSICQSQYNLKTSNKISSPDSLHPCHLASH